MYIVARTLTALIIVCSLINSGYTQVTRCGRDKFQCQNGECIDSVALCDGQANCSDQSDETASECQRSEILCPSYAFRCAYGACVDGDSTCNGIKDCVDNSDETLPQCRSSTNNPVGFTYCNPDQFTCDNGHCIHRIYLCDGVAHCSDKSDEVFEKCGSLSCLPTNFRCAYGACIDGDKQCNRVIDCVDESDENACNSVTTLPPRTSPTTKQPPVQTPNYVSPDARVFCNAPPQPANGSWRLHTHSQLQCPSNSRNCNIPEGTQLQSGSHIVYSCNPGYKISEGVVDVSCTSEGHWLNIPKCEEIRCPALSTASTKATCNYNNNWVSCGSSVLPGTSATLQCRSGYQRESSFSNQRDVVSCKISGKWEPDPIRCIPECGIMSAQLIPLVVHGTLPNITEFPWHASLYRESSAGGVKQYFCGATIIQENLLLTAAHCITVESGRYIENPGEIHVLTGNIFKEYDSPLHDTNIVRQNQVKKFYTKCDYIGNAGNYRSDIAILELVRPFVLTSFLMPACIAPETFSERVVLEAGSYGKVAGFGRTAFGASSEILQSLQVPYVSYSECTTASENVEKQKYITHDKFCAGYKNGSSVCNGDSGGGLVFQTNNLWYLRGIVSVSLGTIKDGGTTYCDNHLYSLYTKISSHIAWIQNVQDKVNLNEEYSQCLN